jgi:LemA protein
MTAFLTLAVLSFLSIRPILKDSRIEAKAEWDAFMRAVKERNELLPGVIEAMKGFEPGHGRMVESALEARSIAMRATDPDKIVASIDDIDRNLAQLEKVVQSKPELAQYPPFSKHWKRVLNISRRVNSARKDYNNSVRLYNRLLTPFPQNMLTTLFGFVPLIEYPPIRSVGEEEF